MTASVTHGLGRTFTASGTIAVWDTMGLSFKLPEFSHPDEMVKVIQCQRAFSYALKVVTTADEIESTINSLRG